MSNDLKSNWEEVKKGWGDSEGLDLSEKTSSTIKIQTAGLLHILARYKFAMKMLANRKNLRVLDLGCNDGLGDLMISQNCDCKLIKGIDFDEDAINWANKSIANDVLKFECKDFFTLGNLIEEKADCVLSLDVIEHIPQEKENDFVNIICNNMKKEGVAIIGTPNITMYDYASPWCKKAHINNYDQKRLYGLLDGYFENVFIFGMTDEVLHTGFYPFACYIMAMAVGKR